MFSEQGIAAVLQFGALGLLGAFMYLSYQSYKSQIDFQQKTMMRVIEVIKDNTSAHQQAVQRSQAICTSIEMNREMDKKEHQALMDQHKMLTDEHKHITQKLSV